MAAEQILDVEDMIREWRGMADTYGRQDPNDRGAAALRFCAEQLHMYWQRNCERTVPLLPHSIQRLIMVSANFDGNDMPDVEQLIAAAEQVKAGLC